MREELAMNLLQNLDTKLTKPPKSLPPLKKAGKAMNLEPMPKLKELKKLGPIPKSMAAPMDSAFQVGLRSLSLNPSSLKPLGHTGDFQLNGSLGAESEPPDKKQSSLTLRDDSVQNTPGANVIKPIPKKSTGLKLTGAGSAFMKRDLSKSESVEDKDESSSEGKPQVVLNPLTSQEKGKPFKSILVNSIPSNLRSQKQSTNGKWNVDLDNLKGDEQSVWNQIQSSETRASTVKFKLDEDTELHFETSFNENLENNSEESKETTEQESEDDEDSDKDDSETDVSQSLKSLKKEESVPSKFSLGSNPSNTFQPKSSKSNPPSMAQSEMRAQQTHIPASMVIPNKSIAEVTPAVNGSQTGAKQALAEQMKSLEETISNLNKDRELAVQRVQEQMEKQKSEDIKKAKEEIENILKLEMDKIKSDFQTKIQSKRAELLHQHNKELNESIETLKRQQEQQILNLKNNHVAAMEKMRAEAEVEFELEKSSIREEIRKSFDEEKENLKKKLVQENEFELNKLKFELEQKKCSLEAELQSSIENLQKEIQIKLESAKSESDEHLRKIFQSQALEEKEKELQELRFKYQRLDNKYQILKKQVQFLVENEKSRAKSADTITKSQNEPMYHVERERAERPFTDGELKLIGSENDDSANESDQDIASDSSGSIEQQKSSEEDKNNETQSRDARLYSALKSLDEIRQQILELTKERHLDKTHSIPLESPQQPGSHKLTCARSSRQSQDSRLNSAQSIQKQDQSAQVDEPPNEGRSIQLPNKDLVEEAKDFIRSQRHRLSQQESTFVLTPIATTLGVKQRLELEMRKAQYDVQSPKSKLKTIPPFFNLDHRDISETESSGVGSWKDIQSIQKKKVSEEIDQICQSLTALDGQMKEVWSLVRGGSAQNPAAIIPPDKITKTLSEDIIERKYRKASQPITEGSGKFTLYERQSLPGTIDQLKQMWTSTVRESNNQGDSYGMNASTAYDNHITNILNPGRSNAFNFISGESGRLSTINPSMLQIQQLAFDKTASNLIPGSRNTAYLVETLDEEIKQYKERQERLLSECSAPQNDTAETLHERTKHLREWLDKF